MMKNATTTPTKIRSIIKFLLQGHQTQHGGDERGAANRRPGRARSIPSSSCAHLNSFFTPPHSASLLCFGLVKRRAQIVKRLLKAPQEPQTSVRPRGELLKIR